MQLDYALRKPGFRLHPTTTNKSKLEFRWQRSDSCFAKINNKMLEGRLEVKRRFLRLGSEALGCDNIVLKRLSYSSLLHR